MKDLATIFAIAVWLQCRNDELRDELKALIAVSREVMEQNKELLAELKRVNRGRP